jgi:hypothetical protein
LAALGTLARCGTVFLAGLGVAVMAAGAADFVEETPFAEEAAFAAVGAFAAAAAFICARFLVL